MRVAADLARRHGIDETDVPLHELGESLLVSGFSVAPQQLGIVIHVVCTPIAVDGGNFAQKSSCQW
jgi:hypothetical protein